MAVSIIPSSHVLSQGDTLTFFTSIATSVEFYPHENTTRDTDVQALAFSAFMEAGQLGSSSLFDRHSKAWADFYNSGIEVVPSSDSPLMVEKAMDLAAHINSSIYFLYSSLREDWFPGVSPGGAATQNYQGAVFMDMDFWMQPPLYFLQPKFCQSLLEYRYLSLNTSLGIASVFGYNGSMFAWTAAYLGRPFGCCDGKGGYENCLEQHVTGDIGFSVWQFYQSQRNMTWLRTRGWPLIKGIAEFYMSRVEPKPSLSYDGKYSINGVLPIDEWCVDSGCGCEQPGVDNDAQMNGVGIASLVAASKIANILGLASDLTKLWEKVGTNLVLSMNTTASGESHHNQFDSKKCPGGWGGSHYSPSHTVCPEDVLMLSYPLGDFLNISSNITRADAQLFVPITCKENAGMTTPIHAIVWLSLGETVRAQAELNRSLHAACYGPFHVRNEIDKHADIVGGHYDNSHFLTGDGGFLQAILNGYGGLRIVEKGLKLLHPYLPEGVGMLHFRKLSWRTLTLTFKFDAANMSILSESEEPFCLVDSKGLGALVKSNITLDLHLFSFPGMILRPTEFPSCGKSMDV